MVVHSAAAAAAAAAAVDARGQAALPGMNMLIKVGTDRHEQSEKKGPKNTAKQSGGTNSKYYYGGP